MLLAVPERHLERVMWSPRAGFDPAAWPFTSHDPTTAWFPWKSGRGCNCWNTNGPV